MVTQENAGAGPALKPEEVRLKPDTTYDKEAGKPGHDVQEKRADRNPPPNNVTRGLPFDLAQGTPSIVEGEGLWLPATNHQPPTS
jgi:hypothetical protein